MKKCNIVRILDVCISCLIIIALLPILIVVVLVLKITGEGEIFYLQKRMGFAGIEFNLIKFATMLKNSPQIGAGDVTIYEDPRVLRFGKFLRKTKLNEIPQLWNVIIGEMSLVGPRPLTKKTFDYYHSDAQRLITRLLPGLTGVGSILFRDEEKFLKNHADPALFYKSHIAPYKGSLEIWYYHNRNIKLYLTLILATGWSIFYPSSNILHRYFNDLPKIPIVFELEK
jgi:lipopolysaccharide/colanic/teichoic acid biosynthesis glycosyltransferase